MPDTHYMGRTLAGTYGIQFFEVNKVEVRYRPFLKTDCNEVINLWSKTEGIYLHSNGEDSVEGIKAYLDRNSGFSFVADKLL